VKQSSFHKKYPLTNKMNTNKKTLKDFKSIYPKKRKVTHYSFLGKIKGFTLREVAFLSELIYWSAYSRNGAVFRSIPEIEETRNLTKSQQATAEKNLEKMGIISRARGVKRYKNKRYFEIHWDRLIKLLLEATEGIGDLAEESLEEVNEMLESLSGFCSEDIVAESRIEQMKSAINESKKH